MGDSSSGSEGSSSASVNEKGSRNKRKYLSDLSVEVAAEVSTVSLTEFPRYEMLEEKFRNALNELGQMMARCEEDEQELEKYQQQVADWDDPIACELEKLLTNNLYATFCSAVKKIVECGYTEEAAEWAVLNVSLFYGSKDAVSNVVDGALTLLKREKDVNAPKHPLFDGLQSLVDYTLLEMVHVLREVRPSLSITEAMWCLLISDLNLVNACVLDGMGPTSGGESLSLSQSKSEASGTSQSDSDKLGNQKQIIQQAQKSQQPLNKEREGPLDLLQEVKGKFSGNSRDTGVDEKSGRKGLSASSKRDMLRQRAFHFEKNYKGRLSKGSFKAKVAAWGSMVLDKSLKSQSGSSGVVMKGTYSKLTSSAGSIVEGNSESGVKNTVFAIPVVNPTPKSPSSSAPTTSPKDDEINASRKATDYYASIPFDETLKKYIPRNDKDDAILMLVPHMQALEKELQGWTNWANEKVMQAARRLGKDQNELKMLRQEKEEIERFKKEKQTLEESTMKRLSEMENALSNATGQIEVANCSVRRLDEENLVLKKDMEDAKIQALESATNLQEALVREQDVLKKLQSWEVEKGLVLEQMANLRRKIAELGGRLEKAKERQNQFKVLLKQEEKEKLKASKQIDILRGKQRDEDSLMQAEADTIKQTAETNMQKCEQDIKNLQSMISELRLESDKSKIAALNVGYGSTIPAAAHKRLAVFQDNFGNGEVKPERECVMCMSDEISVVFLPCAHQVLCGQCSSLHEKQGMKDCPSCRTTIQKRVSVSYRVE